MATGDEALTRPVVALQVGYGGCRAPLQSVVLAPGEVRVPEGGQVYHDALGLGLAQHVKVPARKDMKPTQSMPIACWRKDG